jgi:hypothetical protein
LSINGPKSVKSGTSHNVYTVKMAARKINLMQSEAGNTPPDDYEYLSEANLDRMSSIKSSALRS